MGQHRSRRSERGLSYAVSGLREKSAKYPTMKSYKELHVWQLAMDITVDVYKATRVYPKDEVYNLVSQMRRASVSISSNIAEGQSRGHLREYVQFLSTSYASAAELETQIELSHRLEYIDKLTYDRLLDKADQVQRMLRKLMQSLRKPLTSNR